MKRSSCAPFAAHLRTVMACALCTTTLTLLPATAGHAQDVACDPAVSDCPPEAVLPILPETAAPEEAAAEAGADLVLPTVEVSAEAPAPAPAAPRPRAPAPRRVAAPVPAPAPVAALAPVIEPVAPINPESRFAARPTRVQDRTILGELSVDAPVAGTALARETLETVGSVSAETDLLLRVPGISMVRNIRIPTGGKGYTNNLVDGFSVRSQSLGKFGFLDEVNLWDAERVEITRGPASVLYSSKAVGGTVNVISRDVPETREGQVSLEAGADGHRRGALNMAGPIGSAGNLGYTFSATTLDLDGWRDRSAKERDAVSGKLVWSPTDDTEVTLRAERLWLYEEHPGRLTQEQFDADWQQAQYRNLYIDTVSDTLSASVTHRISPDAKVELSYGYSNVTGTDACPSGCSSIIASLRQVEVDHTSHNLRGLYTLDLDPMDSRLSFGVDAFKSRKIDETYSRRPNSLTRGSLVSAYTIDETSIAPFAQWEFSPIEDLRFSLGARWENYDLDVDDRSPLTDLDGSKSYSELVTKAGATWEYAPNSLFWASVAEGYFVPSTTATITSENARDLPAESSLTYSFGLRGELAQGAFGYDLGLYRSTINDQAVSLECGGDATLCPGDPTGSYSVAAGKVRYRGLETQLYWRASKAWRFDLSHTFARNTYVDFVTDEGDFSGKTASASPKHHLNLRATYSPNEQLSLEAEADWISSYYTNESNTDSYQRPWLVNLRANYAVNERVGLYAAVENVFDVKYAKRVSATEDPVPVRGYNEGYAERTFRVGLSAKF
ncbi:TonB-dependent receptor [Pseudothioclava nitratireducens]|uniref:TonB-dependent receptor n=1 Tax=Pseudothioclava nitratireducens TaxID=1928646 RepID=UPI0023D98B6E|nr:TonB-dependent receptor [Defluviimonas nitratireducens]MDF1620145.1 TonB-dependent receptor [Defluviimonas nitratireducens]